MCLVTACGLQGAERGYFVLKSKLFEGGAKWALRLASPEQPVLTEARPQALDTGCVCDLRLSFVSPANYAAAATLHSCQTNEQGQATALVEWQGRKFRYAE